MGGLAQPVSPESINLDQEMDRAVSVRQGHTPKGQGPRPAHAVPYCHHHQKAVPCRLTADATLAFL